MIEQQGDSVTVTGRPLLGVVYRAVLNHIAHRRQNGMPSDDLRQLARMLRRAYVSSQRLGRDTYTSAQSCSGGELIDSAEAARMLAVSRRQAQRLAARGLATRRGQVWLYPRAAVLELAQQRKAAS